MRNIFKLCLLGAAAAFIAAPAPASAEMWNIDFDHGTDAAGNNIDFAPNTIFSSRKNRQDWQRYDGQSGSSSTGVNPGDSGVQDPNGGTNHPGVTFTIDAWNHNAYGWGNGGRGSAVGYDSTMNTPTGTSLNDRDLEETHGGFKIDHAFGKDKDGNDIARTGYGNILILQSHESYETKKCGGGLTTTGVCETSPVNGIGVKSDDQAGGYYGAGDLTFDFDEEVTLVKMNIFDIEESGGKVKFYDLDEDGNVISVVAVVDIPVIGDNGVGLLYFNDVNPLAGIKADRMMVWLAGSGAIDNIMGDSPDTTTTIPEPGTMALFGFGLAAVGFYRRRRHSIGDRALAV